MSQALAERHSSINSLVLLFPLILAAAGCDGQTVLKGYVVDGDGEPVPSARITLTRNGQPVGIQETSKLDGSFSVGGTHPASGDPFDFRVEKKGFRDDIRRLPPESNDTMRVVLERDKAAGPRTEKGDTTETRSGEHND